ncbi:MAG: DUF5689 domain-containing protein [Paludibacter sp.]|nr:DUF5689 domain-containing protein [Bacteroidales bacterium]MCM1068808.1 DUF5689 domain-containing protein [Prevotella sp.]MCM1353949.1 DUF5689 domain-containing protein [Bacteroides sp.]MCM1443347.1 DUF5689 domain-containing protein [Muribaculum sp.]MCM1482112.1 DUF5689 domain-containing protein [Paludibacter sp.]
MKKNIVYILLTAVFALAACTPQEIAPDQWYISEDEAQKLIEADGGRLYTLNGFVDTFMTDCGVIFPVRQRSYTYSGGKYQMDPANPTTNNRGWFSIDTIPNEGSGIYIRGRIVTEDYDGNFYKSMVIQATERINGEQQALRISVDMSNAGGQYALGQVILIRVNGLAIGKYANEPQLCVPAYTDNIFAMNASQKVGWAPGRIPAPMFQKAVTFVGKPEPEKIIYDDITLSDIINSPANDENYHKMDGRLVRINNVHFAQAEGSDIPGMYDNYGTPAGCTNGNPETDQNSCVFGPTTNNLGFPQGRIIDDGTAQSLVSTSEYAKFAHIVLPTADYSGTIEGILGHYTDNGRNDPDAWDWSITLRSRYDIKLTNADGETWVMKEYNRKN